MKSCIATTTFRAAAVDERESSTTRRTSTGTKLLSPVDLLQSALNDETRSHFEALGERSTHPSALSIWTFLQHFMDLVEKIHRYQHRKPLAGEDYLHCKRVLYAAFLEMDKDDDGLVRYEDLLDYLAYRRSLLNEMPKDQVFVVEQSYVFRSSPGVGDGAKRPSEASSSSTHSNVPEAADEEDPGTALTEDVLQEELAMKKLESLVVSFDQPGRAKFLTGKRRGRRLLGLVNKSTNRDVVLVNEALQVVDGFSCGSATQSPIVDLDGTTVDELVVTSHADRTIRVWSDRDCRGLNRGKWREAYHHTTSSIVTTVCSHPRSDRLFTGGSDGEIVLWRISNALLLDKLRGDRAAFDQLVVKVWEAGSVHRDSVKAIAAFERVDRIASCALDGSIGVIDVPRQCELQSFRSPRGILSIAVCESFSLLCTAGYDRDPFVWDYTAALRMPTRLVDTADPHTDCIVSVSVLEGATTLIASCDASSKLKLWDLRMLRCVQSLTLDREGVENNVTAATRSSAPQHLVSTMFCTSSAATLSIVGRKWYHVAEQKAVQSKSMGPSPVIRTAFDMQTGSLLALHEDSSISVWFSGARRAVLAQKQLTHSRSECVKTMEVFFRGRRVVLGTSDGRIVIVNIETATVGESVEAFPQKAAVKTVVLGTFDARPFISALAVDGSLFHWYHPALPPHSVLPPHVHVTALAIGNMEASLWLGTATGSVYHLYVVESFTGPELLSPSHQPSPVTHLVRLNGLGVMALLRADSSFVLFNANFEGELLHQQRLVLAARSAAAIPHSRRDPRSFRRTAEAYLALGDDSGRVVVIRVSSGIFHPNSSGRARHCVSVADRSIFSQAVLSLEGLAHWSAFAAVCEDGTGKIIDRYGVELAVLAQHASQPWPVEVLPVVTNAEHSARVVAKIHAFFSLLRSRANARKRTENSLLERRRSTMRRASRHMSFSHKAGEPHESGDGDALHHSESSAGALLAASTSFLRTATGVLLDSSEWGKRSPRNAVEETHPGAAGGRGCRGSLGGGDPYTTVLSEVVSLEEVQPLHPMLPRQTAARPTVSLHRGGVQRPATAPSERERLAATVPKELPKQHIIGSEGIRKAAVAKTLQHFVGQVATVGGDSGATRAVPGVVVTRVTITDGGDGTKGSRDDPPSRLITTRRGGSGGSQRECSHRCVLGPAMERVKLQLAMEEQELPPSVLWAPLPRPPSPLESRVQRRSKR